MRVAVVALYPLDVEHIAGGMRTAVYHLVHALSAFDDLDVHVVYCHAEVPNDRVVHQGRATAHYLSLPRWRLFPNYVRSLMRIRRALAEIRPDVVHAHTSHFAIPGLWAGLPTVLTLHGAAHREAAIYNRRVYDRLRFGLATLYDRYTLARVKDIVAISPYIMREYGGMTRARWHQIVNPLPDEYFALARAEEPGRLLFAGTITPLKGVMTLLRALVRVREGVPAVRLRLAGAPTDPSYQQELRRFSEQNGLAGNVEFLGLLDPLAMRQEYAACSALVLPSRQEVLPMVVIEAMAAGAPVVASRAGGLTDLIEDEQTGLLVEVGDDVGLAAAIIRLLKDDELRRRLGRRGRAVAQERFRAAAVAERYRDVYQLVVQRGKSA